MMPPGALSPEQEERLARYRAQAMPAAEREAFEREVLANDALAEALYSEQLLDAATSVRRGAGLRRPRGGRFAWARALAAASVVVVAGIFVLRSRAPESDGDSTRGSRVGTASARADRVSWGSVAGAARYRLTLVSAAGQALADTVVADTSLARGFVARDPRVAAWYVTPLTEDGVELPVLPLVPLERR